MRNRNHLGPFSEATDCHVGQEQGGGAVGGQGQLRTRGEIETWVLNMLQTWFWCQIPSL